MTLGPLPVEILPLEERQFSYFFSLTPFYLALVCAGKGGMMMMMSKNLKVLNKNCLRGSLKNDLSLFSWIVRLRIFVASSCVCVHFMNFTENVF
jgi:hypothetical protein